MSWEVVHDDGITTTERWREALFYIREESRSVHRSIDHEGSDDAVMAQAGHKGGRLPMSVRNRRDQSLAAQAAASEPHHVGAGCGLVDKYQSGGVKHALLSYPTSARPSDVGSLLLGGVQTFF